MKKLVALIVASMLAANLTTTAKADNPLSSTDQWRDARCWKPKELVTSGTELTLLAGIRFLGRGNKFLVATGSPNANIMKINHRAKVLGVAVPTQTITPDGKVFLGFADDLALTSDKKFVSLSGLSNGQVTQYNKVCFGKYAHPEAFNVGPPPFPPIFPSQLGFVNPVAYDANDTLHAANIPIANLSNSVFRMSLESPPFEFKLFNKSTGEFDPDTGLNAFDFGPDGKLYSPAPNNGSVLKIDLIEDSSGARAEYTEVITGLEQPISVRVNEDGLLVTIDRTTGFVWKFELGKDTEATFVASLEPGLDNFDFFGSKNILVTANRNRIWQVNLHNGRVKTMLASPVALPNAISAGKSNNDSDKLYVADTYAIVVINSSTGCVDKVLTPFNAAGLSSLSFINALHVSEDKIYASDNRTRLIAILDRETLQPLDLFGGFIPNNIPFTTQINYPIEDEQGRLLLTLPASGQIVRITRVGGQQINEVVVDNVPVPYALARDNNKLYISDLGTDDTNGAVYVYDLTSGSTQATLLKSDLARPKGLTILNDKVLVVESAASQITAIDKNGNARVIANDLEIQYAPSQTTASNPVPVGIISDIATTKNDTIFFGTNLIEGSIQYLEKK